jgi:hypothetical protein
MEPGSPQQWFDRGENETGDELCERVRQHLGWNE